MIVRVALALVAAVGVRVGPAVFEVEVEVMAEAGLWMRFAEVCARRRGGRELARDLGRRDGAILVCVDLRDFAAEEEGEGGRKNMQV